MAARHNSRIAFWKGWDAATREVWEAVADVPRDSLTPEQGALRSAVLDCVGRLLLDEEDLKPKPTNADLAAKYAVSRRTVTNWRREGCPFEDGQWGVLDWMAERRYVPATARAKFSRQLERRNRPLTEWESLPPSDALITRRAKKLGLLPRARR